MLHPRSRNLLRFLFGGTKSQRAISRSSEVPFSEEQKCQILEKLNNGSEFELEKYAKTVTFSRFMKYREQHGKFETFENLFAVDGVTRSGVLLFCARILMQRNKDAYLTTAFDPVPNDERFQAIYTVTSLSLDLPFLTFVKMDQDCRVIDWRRSGFMDDKETTAKTTLGGCYELVASAYPKLPLSDIFIMDQILTRPPGRETVTSNNKKIMQAMLYTMLTFGEQEQPKVIHINPTVMTNYFDLAMGFDRVSCQDTFAEHVEREEIKLSISQMNHYDRGDSVGREFLGLNALQCMMFMRARSLLRTASTI